MLKDMIPQRWLGYDCIHLDVSNILLYKEYRYANTIWKQCATLYMKSQDQQLGILGNEYLTRDSELIWLHHIKQNTTRTNDPEHFKTEICSLLDLEEPVIVPIDTFYFQPSMYYKNRHMFHTITIVDYKDNNFTIIDHAYLYKGEISFEQLLETADTSFFDDNNNFYECSYISLQDSRNLCIDDYLTAINVNYHVKKGGMSPRTLLEQTAQGGRFNYLDNGENYTTVIGIDAISHFITDYKHLLSQNKLTIDDMFPIYSILVSVSNNNYLYASFLKEFLSSVNDSPELVVLHMEIAQDWKVASNMILKGLQKNSHEMLTRMFSKVGSIYQKELHLLELVGSFLMRNTRFT